MASDLNIVTSPAALRMLQMVTAGFYDNSIVGLWIFETIGREVDTMAKWAKELHNEIFPQTCTWSIDTWEQLYDIEKDGLEDLELRRQRLMAKALYSAPINPEVIRRGVAALAGCEDVTVAEHTAPYTFEVTVNHTKHIPNQGDVWMYIYLIKPSHLSFRLLFIMETPVYHEMQAALLGGQIAETETPEIPVIHQAEERLAVGGLSHTIVEVKVDEIVAKREIAKLVQIASITQSISEKEVPAVKPIHKPEATTQIGGTAFTVQEATTEEIQPEHGGATRIAAGGRVSEVQEAVVQEIHPPAQKATEGNVGGLVQMVEETTIPEFEQLSMDCNLHTKGTLLEVTETTLKKEDEQ